MIDVPGDTGTTVYRLTPEGGDEDGWNASFGIGSVSTDLVAIEARKAMEGTDAEDAELLDDTGTAGGQGIDGSGAKVISLQERRLSSDQRTTLPDMSKYDRLLAPAVTRQHATNQKGHGA